MKKISRLFFICIVCVVLLGAQPSPLPAVAQSLELFDLRHDYQAPEYDSYDIDHNIYDSILADFTADGILDYLFGLVDSTATPDPKSALYQGNGDGTFTRLPSMPDRIYAPLKAGDFNADGKLDLASHTYIYLGNGDGTFQARVRYQPTSHPTFDLVLGDFNQDGKLDLVNLTSLGVNEYLGNGDGTFQPVIVINPGAPAFSLAAGDFNLDGLADLAVVVDLNTNWLVWMFGNGDGTFTLVNQPAGYFYDAWMDMATGDFNDDGQLDILFVAGNFYGGYFLKAFLSQPDGSHAVDQTVGILYEPGTLVVQDFNQDGHQDVAVFARDTAIYLGNGKGTFGLLVHPNLVNAYNGTSGDINGDTYPDLISTTMIDTEKKNVNYSVALNRGDGTFRDLPQYMSLNTNTSVGAIQDFDLDGIPDVIGTKDKTLYFSRGQDDFTFTAPLKFNMRRVILSLRSAYLNADPYPDLVFLAKPDELGVVFNSAGRNFGRGRTIFHSYFNGIHAMTTADFNQDGLTDIALCQTGPTSALGLLPNAGRGNFFLLPNYLTGSNWSVSKTFIPADFNGDGLPDLLFSSSSNPGFALLFNRGKWRFDLPVRPTNPAIYSKSNLAVADFNEDGFLDVAAPGNKTSISLGNGDGTFQPYYQVDSASNVELTHVVDFNLDGHMDLVMANPKIYAISVQYGRGDGTFEPHESFGVPDQISAISVMDYDQDSLPDLVYYGTRWRLGAYQSGVSVITRPHSVDLDLEMTALSDPALLNQTLTYSLQVTNHGPHPASGVRLLDALPAGFQFVSAEASQGTCSHSQGWLTCDLDGLGVDEDLTVRLTGLVTQPDVLTNSAQVFAAEKDLDNSNHAASLDTTVIAPDPPFTPTFTPTVTATFTATPTPTSTPIPPGTPVSGISESFDAASPPSGWVVVNNASNIGWRFDNPGKRPNLTGGSGNFAIADSARAGLAVMDTELRTPILDLGAASTVTLQFKTFFKYHRTSRADVDVSADGGITWTNVWSKSGVDFQGTVNIDLSNLLAGRSNGMVRFHYHDAIYAQLWQVDNVKID